MVAIIVKWGKQQFDVELDTSQSVETFKAQLLALTSVPIERQKIMGVKGGQLKDNADWAALGIKPGQKLMLMGTAEVLAAPPEKATVFAEDLPPDVVAAAQAINPPGLANLGNTCYLNSSLQCMRAIPEIGTSVQKFVSGGGGSSPQEVAARETIAALKELNGELDRGTSAKEVTPYNFVGRFRQAFPMFAQQNEGGRGYQQQDAEECWSTLVNAMAQCMQLPEGDGSSNLASAPGPVLPRMEQLKANLADKLFGVELETTYKCVESEAEEAYTQRESKRTIGCYISDKTAHLYNAIETALDEVVEKTSPSLGREAQYEKKSRIARLPPYLAVHFVRFAYRKDTEKRAKILRTVTFPPVLDIRNLCTAKLTAAIGAHCSTLEKDVGIVPVADAMKAAAAAAAAPAAAAPAAAPAAAVAAAAGGEGKRTRPRRTPLTSSRSSKRSESVPVSTSKDATVASAHSPSPSSRSATAAIPTRTAATSTGGRTEPSASSSSSSSSSSWPSPAAASLSAAALASAGAAVAAVASASVSSADERNCRYSVESGVSVASRPRSCSTSRSKHQQAPAAPAPAAPSPLPLPPPPPPPPPPL